MPLYVVVEVNALEVSLVDHTPEELLAATLIGLRLEYAAGIGPDNDFISLRLSLDSAQLDDEQPATRSATVHVIVQLAALQPLARCHVGHAGFVWHPPCRHVVVCSQSFIPPSMSSGVAPHLKPMPEFGFISESWRRAVRFPVILRPAPLPEEGQGEVQALVQMTAIMQGKGPRGQPYYPFLSFRMTRPLLVRRSTIMLAQMFSRRALQLPGCHTRCRCMSQSGFTQCTVAIAACATISWYSSRQTPAAQRSA